MSNPTLSYTTLVYEATFSKNVGMHVTIVQLRLVINLLNQAYAHLERYTTVQSCLDKFPLEKLKLLLYPFIICFL
ncbi:hypothetical protein DK880_00594 [Candidatus Cardinium hertigii]|uniref:Uncharacterized protein n=1 Tax=Candidatus Cardinium hertigii TaxID=247481 RepID=A0A2Z3LIM8_9BACT|nr:hypothetical protein DK880_00594 [Candidatus Cardinium hertigii]